MKKLYSILVPMALGIFFTVSVFAQAPDKMSYQAVIRNSSGALVANTIVSMKISIQKYVIGIPPTFQNVYIETHSVLTNENGLAILKIGDGTIVGGIFANIDWSDGEFYIKTETDPAGGSNYTITGTSQILSVPYALYAKNAKTYKIGDFAHGGIVFWVDETGQHGLVCALNDQSAGVRWNAGTSIKTRAFGYSGKDNTLLIIAAHTIIAPNDNEHTAARVCNEYVKLGATNYGGWFLPSIQELRLMYIKRTIVNQSAISNGGTAFSTGVYWSSTEFGTANLASYKSLVNGAESTDYKTNQYRVRAVRAF